MSIRLPPVGLEVLRTTAAGNPRAKAVLLSAEGRTNREVAEEVGVTERTVARWLRRFRAGGIESLSSRHRAGRPPSVTARQATEVVRQLSVVPPPSVREVARSVGISVSSAWRIARRPREEGAS